MFNIALIIACSWLTLKVVVELIMDYIVNNDGRKTPTIVYRGVIISIVMMVLVPPLINFGYSVSTELTNVVINKSSMGKSSYAENKISRALISATSYNQEMDHEDKEDLLDLWKIVDINETEGGLVGIGDHYLYSLNFIMLIILSLITVFLFFFIAIQMSKRVMELALYKIIAPFCCTSLTNNKSKAFETWIKYTMGLLLTSVIQFLGIGLFLNLFNGGMTDATTITKIFLIIGALLFVIGTPAVISSLLGHQTGIMSAFGDIQSMMAIGSGINLGVSSASSLLGSGVSVIPKSAGHISGIKQQFSQYRQGGNSVLNSISKTAFSEASKPFTNTYQRFRDKFSNNYNSAKARNSNIIKPNFSNPFKNPFSMKYNPIKNQYMSQAGLDANSNFDRKWY